MTFQAFRILLLTCLLLGSVLLRAASCGLSTPGLSFGAVDVLSRAPRDSSTSITVTCTGSGGELVSYTITSSLADYSGTRKLTNGRDTLRYNIFVDGSRTAVFGDGTNGSTVIGDSITLAGSQTQNVQSLFARMEGNQNTLPPGTYVDTLILTVSY